METNHILEEIMDTIQYEADEVLYQKTLTTTAVQRLIDKTMLLLNSYSRHNTLQFTISDLNPSKLDVILEIKDKTFKLIIESDGLNDINVNLFNWKSLREDAILSIFRPL